MLVVHPHFHPRRSGVTGHTELIVPALATACEARAIGALLPPAVPRITFSEVWRRARTETVVWHAHRNNELLCGLFLRLFRPRTRVVFTSHSPRPHGLFTHFLIRFVDALVTLNAALASFIKRPSRIVQHGLDLTRFHPPADRAQAWKALGLEGERGLGVVGRVRPNKGQADFVAAVAPLLTQNPGWTPVLVGLVKDADRAWAESLKASAPSLVLAGVKTDTAPWYQGLSVVVQPSHGEAFSMVLIEAMASGCAVVATRLPAVAEVVEDGVSGFLFEPGYVLGLRALLAKLLADPALVARVGAAAAARAKERFGIEHEAAALLQVYRRALEAEASTPR
jgi:mannosyltransferase